MKKSREQINAESKQTVENVVAWYKADKGKKFFKRRWFITVVALLIAKGVFFGGSDTKEAVVPKVQTVAVAKPVVKPAPKPVVLTPAQKEENRKKAIVKAKADAVAKAKEDAELAVWQAEQAKATAKAEYQTWVDSQFSGWDGSHIDLVKLVKQNLNDDKSFKHEKTTYTDNGKGTLVIHMTYRATNGFGATILQNVTATADRSTNMIKITSTND